MKHQRANLFHVGDLVSPQPAPRIRIQFGPLDYHVSQAVQGNFVLPALIIESSLLPSVDSAHSDPVLFIEERHSLVMLRFPILDNQSMPEVVSIDRKKCAPATLTLIASEPSKPMLATGLLGQDFIAEVHHIRLIPAGASPFPSPQFNQRRGNTLRPHHLREACSCGAYLLVGKKPTAPLVSARPRIRPSKPSTQYLARDIEFYR